MDPVLKPSLQAVPVSHEIHSSASLCSLAVGSMEWAGSEQSFQAVWEIMLGAPLGL